MISFRPASRDKTPLIIGLAGPSRSGKTFSALRLATGLAAGKPIVMLDTESGRGLQYADRFSYMHGSLSAPFTPERYAEAIDDAMKIEPGVIIIDSLSHMHEGPGGVLEQHDAELDRMAGDDWKKRERMTFTAWIKPKHAVNRFVNKLLQTPVHFVLCFRAKDKLKIVPGQQPLHMGWTPICTDRMEYECSALLVLPEGSRGTPDLDAVSSGLRDPFDQWIKAGAQLDESLGAKLATWSVGGATVKQSDTVTLAAVLAAYDAAQTVPGFNRARDLARQLPEADKAAAREADKQWRMLNCLDAEPLRISKTHRLDAPDEKPKTRTEDEVVSEIRGLMATGNSDNAALAADLLRSLPEPLRSQIAAEVGL